MGYLTGDGTLREVGRIDHHGCGVCQMIELEAEIVVVWWSCSGPVDRAEAWRAAILTFA